MAKKKIIPKENITLNIQAGTERTMRLNGITIQPIGYGL